MLRVEGARRGWCRLGSSGLFLRETLGNIHPTLCTGKENARCLQKQYFTFDLGSHQRGHRSSKAALDVASTPPEDWRPQPRFAHSLAKLELLRGRLTEGKSTPSRASNMPKSG